MNTVLGNAIEAILDHPSGGTLHDLRRFLIEKDYREKFLKAVADPTILYYWLKEYPLLKTNSVGSILTRLDSFLRPRSIRNMVIQQKAVDFESLLANNKIVLCKLSQGLIGVENSYLLGSLLLSKIHQALFRRQQHTERNPVFLYLDEFQNFITPSIVDMLSGIRKYNVGLVLSHQDLRQLQRENSELLNSVLSNVTVRIVFRVSEPDAKVLQNSFTHFEAIDLQNLSRGEAIFSIEQPQYDCSITTYPQQFIADAETNRKLNTVINNSRAKYATSKNDVEKKFYESLIVEKGNGDNPTNNVRTQTPTHKDIPKILQPVFKQEIKDENQVAEPVISSNDDTNVSTHRYLQTLVKKMAEARGYTATLEMQLPDGSGQVDVLLSKEGKTVAVEICNSTDASWEMHNISKCIQANYDTVISLSGDIKQLEKIKKSCTSDIKGFEKNEVKFFTPDMFFSFLDESSQTGTPKEKMMKGYRVNVSYEPIENKEADKKRTSVAQIVLNSLKKHKL